MIFPPGFIDLLKIGTSKNKIRGDISINFRDEFLFHHKNKQ